MGHNLWLIHLCLNDNESLKYPILTESYLKEARTERDRLAESEPEVLARFHEESERLKKEYWAQNETAAFRALEDNCWEWINIQKPS